MSKFSRLTEGDRVRIGCYWNEFGKTKAEIAKKLGKSRHTIENEINNHLSPATPSMIDGRDKRFKLISKTKKKKFKYCVKYYVYNPKNAIWRAGVRRGYAGRHVKLFNNQKLLLEVKELLKKGKKPDIISALLKQKYPKDKSMQVSKETIYLFLYRTAKINNLWRYLGNKNGRKKRKPRSKRLTYLQNKDRKSIHDRDESIDRREEIGHFEGDLVLSCKGCKKVILTLVDRKSRKTYAVFCKDKSADSILSGLYLLSAKIGLKNFKSITFDNGTEFAKYKEMEKAFGIEVYFADPYSSWQRGTNERHNGMLRRFFPKKSNFLKYSDAELTAALAYLNTLERKILNYDSPDGIWIEEAA
jgi:IS30 family transposase